MRSSIWMAGLWLAAACGAGPGTGPASDVRDSAGIRIVTDHAPSRETSWSIETVPEVVIGADDGDSTQILYQVRGARVLSGGRIVVAQGPAPMVRWYDADGRFLYGTGRPGGGPGEFGPGEGAWIMELWRLPGDSIATWEHPQRRMQVFDPSGRYTRAVVLELPRAAPVGAFPQMAGRIGGGFLAFLLTPNHHDWPVGVVRRDSLSFVRYHGDGTYAGEAARLPGFEGYTQQREFDGRVFTSLMRPPFGVGMATATTADGFVFGPQDRWQVEVRDASGAVRLLIRRPVARRPLTPALIAAFRERSAPTDPAERRRWEESLDEAPYPDSLPAYRQIETDVLGMVWVQEYYDADAETAAWSVFDRDGRWLTDVAIPTDWQLLDIGDDYLLVLVRDAYDVETVRRHRLRPH